MLLVIVFNHALLATAKYNIYLVVVIDSYVLAFVCI